MLNCIGALNRNSNEMECTHQSIKDPTIPIVSNCRHQALNLLRVTESHCSDQPVLSEWCSLGYVQRCDRRARRHRVELQGEHPSSWTRRRRAGHWRCTPSRAKDSSIASDPCCGRGSFGAVASSRRQTGKLITRSPRTVVARRTARARLELTSRCTILACRSLDQCKERERKGEEGVREGEGRYQARHCTVLHRCRHRCSSSPPACLQGRL
jgi:hypothetical protein